MLPTKRNPDPSHFPIVFAALLLTATNASAQPFEVVDLGMDGFVRNVPAVSSGALGISDDDVVVGWVDYINPPPPAYQFQLPMMTCEGCEPENLPLPEYREDGAATAISADGSYIVGVAGQYFNPLRQTPNSHRHGTIIHEGESQWLANTGIADEYRWRYMDIYDVNNSGEVIGRFRDGTPMVWRDGAVQPLVESEGYASATAINNYGEIAGDFSTDFSAPRKASLWKDDVRVELPLLPENTTGSAMALNDLGQVVGWSGDSGGLEQAVLWEAGAIQALGALPGADSSMATGINNRGQIVGTSGDKPVLWQCGQIQDLNSLLIGRDSSWNIVEVSDINNNGRMVGIGIKDGKQRAILLKPVGRGAAQAGSCPGSNGRNGQQGSGRR